MREGTEEEVYRVSNGGGSTGSVVGDVMMSRQLAGTWTVRSSAVSSVHMPMKSNSKQERIRVSSIPTKMGIWEALDVIRRAC